MEKLTYTEAYNLIIQAYFRDEIQPFNANFCFCGTLAGNDGWIEVTTNLSGYSRLELVNMEAALYSGFVPIGLKVIRNRNADLCINGAENWTGVKAHPQFEDALFAGMSAALDVLKEIHRARGEDVDGVEVFTKRNLNKEHGSISIPITGSKELV